MNKEKSKKSNAFIFANLACEEIGFIFKDFVDSLPQNQRPKELKDRARLNYDFIKAIWKSSPTLRKCVEEFGVIIRFEPPTSLIDELRKPNGSSLTLTTRGYLAYSGPLSIRTLVGRPTHTQQAKDRPLIEGEMEEMIDNKTNPSLMNYFADLTGGNIVETIKTALLNLVDPATMGQSI